MRYMRTGKGTVQAFLVRESNRFRKAGMERYKSFSSCMAKKEYLQRWR